MLIIKTKLKFYSWKIIEPINANHVITCKRHLNQTQKSWNLFHSLMQKNNYQEIHFKKMCWQNDDKTMYLSILVIFIGLFVLNNRTIKIDAKLDSVNAKLDLVIQYNMPHPFDASTQKTSEQNKLWDIKMSKYYLFLKKNN